MFDKLDRILEYRALHMRLALAQRPFEGPERARYLHLREQLPSSVPSLDDRDPYTLLPEPLPALVLAAGTSLQASVRNVSASGLALATEGPPPGLGETVSVTIHDARAAVEYAFTGTVVARVVKGVFGMAIAFEGAGTRARIGGQSGVFPSGGTGPAREASTMPPTRTWIGNPHASSAKRQKR